MKKSSWSITVAIVGISFAFVLLLLIVTKSFVSKKDSTTKHHKQMSLATGLPNGTYDALGKAIAAIGQNNHWDIRVRTTGGSYDNISLVREGKANLALAQIDALDAVLFHQEAHAEDTHQMARPFLLTFLYSEMVHMLLRPHFYVNSPADLKQVAEKVWLGPSGSGSRLTAERVLQASGIADPRSTQWFPGKEINDWNAAKKRLLAPIDEGGLYVFFWTRAYRAREDGIDSSCKKDDQNNVIECLLKEDAHIGALSQDVISRMTEDNLYVATAIPLQAYGKKLNRGVPTVGIPTVLITSETTDSEEVRDLLDMIEDNKSSIERSTGIDLDLLGEKLPSVERWSSFVHPAAQRHLIAADHTSLVVWVVIGVLLVLLCWLIFRPPRVVRSNSPVLSYALLLVVILGTLWVTFAVKLTALEGRFSPNFETVSASMKTMLLFVLGSSHEGKLMTKQGENLTLWALFLIPIVFGWLMSDTIQKLVENLSKRLDTLFSRLGGHHSSGPSASPKNSTRNSPQHNY